ncbi:MAG: molybdopterin-dependent oxidoreductase [Nitrososphaeria archaeon]
MSTDKNDGGNFTVSRRDFLKIAGAAAVAAGAAYAVAASEGKFKFTIFSTQVNDEQLQPGYTYSYVPTMCGICSSVCDALVNIEQKGGYVRATEIDGNPLSTLNYGKLCARGRSGTMITYNKDRIKTPLIRTGPKGTWAFKEATWDEAISYIKQKMQELNVQPWEMVLGGGAIPCANYRPEFIPFTFGSQIPNIAGSPMQPCLFGEQLGVNLTIGTFDAHGLDLVDDFEYSPVIVIWGNNGNPAGVFVNKGSRLGKGLANDAYLIVIDPRASESASKADMWLPVKPGSDLAIAMGLINYIIKNAYYNDEFVRYYTNSSFLAYEENGMIIPYTSEYDDGTVKSFKVYDEISGQIVDVPPYTNTNAYSVDGDRIRPALNVSGLQTADGKNLNTMFGFLAGRVSGFNIDYVTGIAGISSSLLEQFYNKVSTVNPVEIASGLKGAQGSYSTQWRRAIGIIMALKGSIDVRGGWVYSGAWRDSAYKLYQAYNSVINSGAAKPGILIQRPEVLSAVPVLNLPGQMMLYVAIVMAFNNPDFWQHRHPAVVSAYNSTLTSQGLKPAAIYSLFPDTGIYEAVNNKVQWNNQPYNIKMVMTCCVNPAKDMQESEWKHVLDNTFVVMIDLLPTDTALYADVILPDASYIERDEPITDRGATTDSGYRKRWQAVPRVYPYSIPELDLFVLLSYELGFFDQYVTAMANALGLPADQLVSAMKKEMQPFLSQLNSTGAYPVWGEFVGKAFNDVQSRTIASKLNITPEQVMNQLKSQGVITVNTWDNYVANNMRVPWDIPAGLPTGRIEVFSSILYYYAVKNFGYDITWDPLLQYVPPDWNAGYAASPGIYQPATPPYNDPAFEPSPPEFFYIEYKVPQIAYIYTADIPVLYALTSNSYHKNVLQYIWMNSKVAQGMGLNEGDWIVLTSKLTNAQIAARVHLTELIRPDTVGVPMAWGQSNPAQTYSIGSLGSFGNKAVTNMWTKSYDPLTGHRMSEQYTVVVRKATPSEISAFTAAAESATKLPSQQDIEPSYTNSTGEEA